MHNDAQTGLKLETKICSPFSFYAKISFLSLLLSRAHCSWKSSSKFYFVYWLSFTVTGCNMMQVV
jgi:hypothetical protein